MAITLPVALALVAAAAAAVSLFIGVDTMAHGGDPAHDRASARWMGWRVALQFLAVIFIVAAVISHFVVTYL